MESDEGAAMEQEQKAEGSRRLRKSGGKAAGRRREGGGKAAGMKSGADTPHSKAALRTAEETSG